MSADVIVNKNPLEYPAFFEAHVTEVAPLAADPYRPRRGEVYEYLLVYEDLMSHGIVVERNYMLTVALKGPDDHRTISDRTSYEPGSRYWFPQLGEALVWARHHFPELDEEPPEKNDPANLVRRFS